MDGRDREMWGTIRSVSTDAEDRTVEQTGRGGCRKRLFGDGGLQRAGEARRGRVRTKDIMRSLGFRANIQRPSQSIAKRDAYALSYCLLPSLRQGGGKKPDCNRIEFMSLPVLRINTEIFIHRIISGDKQLFTVLTCQRTNKPGSVLGIRRGQKATAADKTYPDSDNRENTFS